MTHDDRLLIEADSLKRRTLHERAGRASPFAQAKLELAKALQEIDRLKKRSAGDVSFSLRDRADDIAALIIRSLGDGRAEEVATAIKRKRGKKP